MLKKYFGTDGKDKTLLLIGIFLALFGVSVITGILFTEDYKGKIVNLASGLLFLIASAICVIGYKNKK